MQAKLLPTPPLTKMTNDNPEELLSGGYTREQLDEMQALGLPKPEEVSWGDWIGPKGLSHKHDLLIHLAAIGKTNNQIAKELEMTPSRISIILGMTEVRKQIREKQDEYYGKDARKRMEALATKSVEHFDAVLSNQQEDSRHKTDVAKYVVDQAVGKAKQDIKVEGNLLSDLISKLDSLPSRQERPVSEIAGTSNDPIDNIASELAGETYVVGKRGGSDEQSESET